MIGMGRITYEMVTDFIKEVGTVSTHKVYEHISSLVPEYDHMRVQREVARKIRTLVKYRILVKVEYGRDMYVHLEGTDFVPVEGEQRICDSISEYLKTVEVGQYVSTMDIAREHQCSRTTVKKIINGTGDFVYDSKTRQMRRVKA